MVSLNIYIGTSRDGEKKVVPVTYELDYPKDELKKYDIYRKTERDFFIHDGMAPYALFCTLSRMKDMLFFERSVTEESEYKDLPKSSISACNQPIYKDSIEHSFFLRSITPENHTEIDAGIAFLTDKRMMLKMLIKKRGIPYSSFKQTDEEIEDREVTMYTNATEDNKETVVKKERVIYYELLLDDAKEHSRSHKWLQKRKGKNTIDFSMYQKSNVDDSPSSAQFDRPSNYVIKIDKYNESTNSLVIKRYPESEWGDKKTPLPEQGYLSESIDRDLILINRQERNCTHFKQIDFPLRDSFLHPDKIELIACPDFQDIDFINKNLKDDQKLAVAKSLGNSPILLINGPPGTGKTTVITEIIAQLTKIGKSVWLSSQTNLAIDNALERLPSCSFIRPIRKGREEKITDKRFCEGFEIEHYFAYQYTEELKHYVSEYEKCIKEFSIIDPIFKKLQKLRDLQEHEKKVNLEKKQTLNSDTVKKFLTWLDKAEFEFLHSIGKDAVKELCLELDKRCPFLTESEKDDFFWKVHPESRNKKLNERLEFLYELLQTDGEKRSEFELYKKEMDQTYVRCASSERNSTIDKQTMEQLKRDVDTFLTKYSISEDILEKKYKSCASKKSTFNEDKYYFYKNLLKLKPSDTGRLGSYEGIVYTPNVMGATCNINPKELTPEGTSSIFDVVIVDEVSKLTWIEMILPIMRGKQLILVGDHHQLPPVFKEGRDVEQFSDIAEEIGFEIDDLKKRFKSYEKVVVNSKFKSLWDTMPDDAKVSLTTQFRCHPDIMNFFNIFYRADRSIGGLTCGLKNPDDERKHVFAPVWNKHSKHLVWVDSSSNERKEQRDEGRHSVYNMYEVSIIEQLLKDLYEEAKKRNIKKEVGIITFYGDQVKALKNKLKKLCSDYSSLLQVEINTVDDFQGKEKDIVVVSLVRNPPKKNGLQYNNFVKEYRRINVAFSRAKELLVVVGARKVFEPVQVPISGIQLPIYKVLIEDNRQNMEIITAEEIMRKNK